MLSAVGRPVDRADGIAKVTGAATYAADAQPAGLLHALAVRSPVASGRILRIDAGAARATEGVVAVVTHADAPALGWQASPELVASSAEGLGRSALEGGVASTAPTHWPLTGPDVFFAGQWVAIVVATSLEAAREAVGSVRVEIAGSDSTVTLAGTGVASLRPGFFFGAEMQVARGPAFETVAAGAAAVIDETYLTPIEHHHPIEPSATLATWDHGELTLHDSTQGATAARDFVALSLGIERTRVRVISTYVGGGFGAKNQMWPHQALAAHLARWLGRPVRLQLTRADMSVASGHRANTRQALALAADRDGGLLAVRHLILTPTSIHGGFFEPCALHTLLLSPAASLRVEHAVQRLNISTPTPFRGPGETPGSFALESAMDELAHALAIDPLALRRRNLAVRDGYHDREWSSMHLLACYSLAATKFGWPASYAAPRQRREGHEWVGFGMATTAYPAPALPASVQVRRDADGAVRVRTAATDIGTGMTTVLGQVVADALGIAFERVTVQLGDSDWPHAPTAGRSKSTASLVPAALDACRALLAQASDADPSAGRSGGEAEGSSTGVPTSEVSFYSFGAHFVEVRVDEQIGRLRVTRICSAFDCGRILNPKLAASQVKGAIIFGIGMALMEKTQFDPHAHRITNDNLADYHLPVNADVPEIDVSFVDRPDLRFNELGIRGLGEIGVPGVAAAIANALFDATGRRVRSLPIGPADLLAACRGENEPGA